VYRFVTNGSGENQVLQSSEQAQLQTQTVLRTPAPLCQGLTYQLTVNGIVQTASAGWLTLLDYAPAHVVGQPLTSFLPPEDRQAVAMMLETLRSTTTWDPHCAEWRWQQQDGAIRWFAVTHSTIYDEHDNLCYIMGSAHEITVYKQQIETLQEELLCQEVLMNALPDPVFVKDDAHRVLLVNEAYCQMVGRSATEILADADQFDPTPADELRIFRAHDRLALASDGPIEKEEQLTDHQGHRHIVSTRKVARILPNGQKVLLCTVRDITERRQIEEKLQYEQALIRRLLDAIPDMIFYKDGKNTYAGCNRAFEKVTQLTEEEMIGKTAGELFPVAAKEEYDRQDHAVLHGKATLRVEQWITYPDGHKALFDTLLTPFLSPTGESLGLLGIGRDITERKRAEEELRTAKETAESANRAKSAFLSTITHELRTPMNGVLGLSGLLLETELNAQQLDLVNTIRESGNTLLTLINDILDFSKVEANKLELEIGSFDLRQCIECALDMVAAQATTKNLTLAYLLDAALPACIEQDETRLRQILANLLSNAVKFSHRGEIVITVTGQAGEDGAWELQFSVHDHGMGIPADRLDRLFRPFSQVEVSTAREYGGSGLGLAISKRLAGLMGGTMWVESEVGKGSCFHFTVQASQSKEECTSWVIDRAALKGRHILLIEKSAAIRRLLVQQLAAWEIKVTTFAHLDEQKLAAQSSVCDALIVDMNALVGASRVHKGQWGRIHHQLTRLYQQYPQLPIVLLTQLGERIMKTEKESKYDSEVVTVAKPIHASQLHDALVTVLSGRPTTARRSSRAYVADTQLAQRHPLRILLAEDNIINQKVVVGVLANHGYRIDVVANGIEVLDALNRQPYELILMDINMPDMNGFATTELIRSSWAPAMQPHIIALTANAMQGDSQRCLDAGMNDYLRKPLDVAELIAALQRTPARNQQPLIQSLSQEGAVAQSPAMPMAEDDDNLAVDNSALRDIVELLGADGNVTVCELIDLFLATTPSLLQQLSEAIKQYEIDTVCQIAHTLRSPTGQLGAHQLANLCEELETICLAGTLVGGEQIFRQIVAEYEQVRRSLHQTAEKFCRDDDDSPQF